MNFDPQHHDYVEHPTYTGPDCAICGRPVGDHNSALIVRSVPRQSLVPRPPEAGAEPNDLFPGSRSDEWLRQLGAQDAIKESCEE